LVFHPVAFTFNDDSFGMVEESIQHGAGQRRVIIEDLGPVFIGLIGREHDRTALVSLADDLKEGSAPVLSIGR
jgi:hypothetical protein